LIILPLRVVIEVVRAVVIDEFEALIDDFGAIVSRSLATVETAANVEVRSINREGIIEGTGVTVLRVDLAFVGDFRGDF
jgi:hypothetical protein